MQLSNIDRWAFIETDEGFKRIGKGVTGIAPSNNPIVDSKHYVDAENPTTTVYGIAKQWSLTMERYTGDPANDYIASFSEELNATTRLVIAEAHEVEEDVAPAKLYSVTVVVNSEGSITGGGAVDMDVEIFANQEGEDIDFDIVAGEIEE